MGILTRFTRLCRADIHGVMDQVENKTLVLKQHLREMEESLDKKESDLSGMKAARERTASERKRVTEKIDAVEADIQTALDKEKDDITRFLIKKQKPLLRYREEIDHTLETLDTDIQGLSDCIEERRTQYESLKARAREYLDRMEKRKWMKDVRENRPDISLEMELSEEEVELELLKRKEGRQSGKGESL